MSIKKNPKNPLFILTVPSKTDDTKLPSFSFRDVFKRFNEMSKNHFEKRTINFIIKIQIILNDFESFAIVVTANNY